MFTTPVSAILTPQEVISPQHKIKALLIQSPNVPLLSLNFTFRGGGAYDEAEKAGLTQFVVSLLDEGAGNLKAEDFQKQLEDSATKLSFTSDKDRIGGNLQAIKDNYDEAFALLKLALTQPRFDEEPLERIRKQMLVAIKRKQEEPDDLASEQLATIIYGAHPYSIHQGGTNDSVKSFTKQDCQKLVKERYARNDLIVSVAGDISPEDLGKRLDNLFGDFPDKSTLPPLADIKLNLTGKTDIIKLNDRPQTVCVFAMPGMKRSNPDFYAAYVLNHIVGGHSFSARLMDEVRTKRGLTYGIGTQLTWNDKTAYTGGSSSTQNERFNESLDVIKAVYKKVAAEGPTPEELKDAQDYLTGSFALIMDSTMNLAQFLTQMQKDGLPIDFLNKRNELIRSVTLDQIKTVAQDLFGHDQLTCVAAGNPV